MSRVIWTQQMDDKTDYAVEDLIVSLHEQSGLRWSEKITQLTALRDKCSGSGNETLANQAWFLLTVARARAGMVSAFEDIRESRHKKAWDTLEQVELRCADLATNPILPLDQFAVVELSEMVRRWQTLFPYKVFASPELLVKKEECTVCGMDVGPWSTCPHIVGHVYDGHLCIRKITDLEILGISMVLDPVQKYSAMIPYRQDGSDPMNYQRVDWVAERVSGPFTYWSAVETSKVFSHAQFEHIQPAESCPCSSGMSYGACCLTRTGVSLPHTKIYLDAPMPLGLSNEVLVQATTGPA